MANSDPVTLDCDAKTTSSTSSESAAGVGGTIPKGTLVRKTSKRRIRDRQVDHDDESGQANNLTASEIIDSWTWSNRPDRNKLEECLNALVNEQSRLCGSASGTTLYSYRFRQRATVLKRYFIAQKRKQDRIRSSCAAQQKLMSAGQSADEDGSNVNVMEVSAIRRAGALEKGSQGLARLGSRAALSFAFAFLRRAWRSGEDSDLCTELLQDTHDALLLLPEASLFDESTVSPVWLEVVDRTSKFLRSVVMGDVCASSEASSSSSSCNIPACDRHTALVLLLEFAVQKGALHEMLDLVKLLLCIWYQGRQRQDNRSIAKTDTSAPLVNFLRRFEAIQVHGEPQQDQDDGYDEDVPASATQCFLQYLEYPQSEDCPIDLQQTAVVIMSHLDRLAIPHQPLRCPSQLLLFHQLPQPYLLQHQCLPTKLCIA